MAPLSGDSPLEYRLCFEARRRRQMNVYSFQCKLDLRTISLRNDSLLKLRAEHLEPAAPALGFWQAASDRKIQSPEYSSMRPNGRAPCRCNRDGQDRQNRGRRHLAWGKNRIQRHLEGLGRSMPPRPCRSD